MNKDNWVDCFQGMISVCDTEGRIIEMNQKIADYFASSGGKGLIGTNLFDCHKPVSSEQIRDLMATKKADVYLNDENGKMELVIHAPLFENGLFAGLAEISLPLETSIRKVKK
jgi:transcriptional regulator with PAS, ATPase and Fis domain